MLTIEQIKEELGKDITFLFKGNEPFTEKKNNLGESKPLGCLIEKEGKIQCYECGKWFERLGIHTKSHKMKVSEYKEKWGFNKSAGLCSREMSRKQSEIARNIEHINTKGLEIGHSKVKEFAQNRKYSIQNRNKRNTCPAQMLKRLELLIIKFGENFSENEARAIDSGLVSWVKYNFGSFNKLKTKMGFATNLKCVKKDDADLIYDIREYVKLNNELPFYYNNYDGHKIGHTKNGFNHSYKLYQIHFGSIKKAWEHCGIRSTHQSKNNGTPEKIWEVIN